MNLSSRRVSKGLFPVLALVLGALLVYPVCSEAVDKKPAAKTEAPKKAESKKEDSKGEGKKSAADLEKEKAMKSPYANDLGPESLPEATLAAYEKDNKGITAGYKLLTAKGTKCNTCHAASRPINSQFVETSGAGTAERMKAAEALKKSDPELFKDKNLWQVEGDIWQRYVKRMMAKPGCGISGEEGKKIWAFLAYDSQKRKTGSNKESWRKHRQGLLDEFKEKYPERYEELYGKHENEEKGKGAEPKKPVDKKK